MLRQQMKIQVIPDDLKKTWNERAMLLLILVSLTLQIVFSLLGNLRRYSPRKVIRNTLWLVYSLAYAVVPLALSIPTQSALDACNNSHPNSKYHKSNYTHDLIFFWAQFLLLHLGGPDTITALSLEDNKLWSRKLAYIVFQSVLALYILLLSWSGCSHLPMLSILVFSVGCIKCFERIQALRLANPKYLRETMLGPADPGPDYVKFLEEFQLKRSQGFNVKVEEVTDHPRPLIYTYSQDEDEEIPEAYDLFQTFKRIFVGLILTYEDRDRSTNYFRHLDSALKAFCAVEIELGFVYDILYTKASVVYTNNGLIRRVTSVLIILLVLLGFHFNIDKNRYEVFEIAITYLVIVAELSKEIFAGIIMLRSDWTDVWLKQHNYTRKNLIFPFLKQPSKQRWCNSIAQLDLLMVALEEKPACFLDKKFFGVNKYLKKQFYETYRDVSFNLKDMIYRHFLEFVKTGSDPKGLCIHKGSCSLQNNGLTDLLWSINEVQFDKSILLWHIATTLCYYSESVMNDPLEINRIESKQISDYLVHLLISNAEMLPKGVGLMRYRDTCAEAIRFFKTKGPISEMSEACRKLLEVNCEELPPSLVKGDQSKSVLFDGCILALALRKIESRKKMWKVMNEVWIEILAYTAAHCRVFHHSQQLGRGGEFLTHVWLLMAHLGMTEHFQISHGPARARFNVT